MSCRDSWGYAWCGGMGIGGFCYCDYYCVGAGDCCWDACSGCGHCGGGSGGGSCMSGNTGVHKISEDTDLTMTSTGSIETVKNLQIGDIIVGYDENTTLSPCTVEAVGTFGFGPLYGNYTDDHFIYDRATGNVRVHGDEGEITRETKYEVFTSCPLALDESGTEFTPIDSDFCGWDKTELTWNDYITLHAAILAVVRQSGGYWFSESAYSDPEGMFEFAPTMCQDLLKCANPEHDCEDLEADSLKFVENYLTDDAAEATKAAFPDMGNPEGEGSVSKTVSGGADFHKSTGGKVVFSVSGVALAVVGLVGWRRIRRRRARSSSEEEKEQEHEEGKTTDVWDGSMHSVDMDAVTGDLDA